jgi:hypothetical protein
MSREEFFKRVSEEIKKQIIAQAKIKSAQAKAELKQNCFTQYETPNSIFVCCNN